MVGDAIMDTGVTKPTIAVALAQFLDEQERRLSPKTAAQYRDVVELLQHQLNGYAYLSLDELDAKRFERLQRATGDVRREFCQVFGPEHILPNVGEFLGYFMVRKVVAEPGAAPCGRDGDEAAGGLAGRAGLRRCRGRRGSH